MVRRYDLEKMVREVAEDEAAEGKNKNIKLSQEDIRRMVVQKRQQEKKKDGGN